MMKRLLGLGALVTGIAALAPGPSAMGALKIVQTGAPFPHRALVVSPPAGTQLRSGNVRVLENGRPLDINWIAEHAAAILEAWFPGVEGGNGRSAPGAEVRVTRVTPVGKLSWADRRKTRPSENSSA